MKKYITKAIHYLETNKQFGKGYSTQGDYTEPIHWGDKIIMPRSKKLTTCCVSSVSQILLTTFNFYMNETGDNTPLKRFGDLKHWSGAVGKDYLKFWIWCMSDGKTKSLSTKDAFNRFKIGREIKFEECETGDFINFSRTNNSGHAVVFCHHADKHGDETSKYNPDNVGFYYISSQGKNLAHGHNAGINYRIGLFQGKSVMAEKFPLDKGIIRNKYLFCTRLLKPSNWQ